MNPMILELDVDGPRVYRDLATKPHFGFSLVQADPLRQEVQLATRMSWVSWGEQITVTVVNGVRGCRVVAKARRLHALNITSNPQAALEKLMTALQGSFGSPPPAPSGMAPSPGTPALPAKQD